MHTHRENTRSLTHTLHNLIMTSQANTTGHTKGFTIFGGHFPFPWQHPLLDLSDSILVRQNRIGAVDFNQVHKSNQCSSQGKVGLYYTYMYVGMGTKSTPLTLPGKKLLKCWSKHQINYHNSWDKKKMVSNWTSLYYVESSIAHD